MLILVTGATGRIGSQLTRALVRRGHRVRAFAAPDHPNAAIIAGPLVEFAAGRLEDVEAVHTAARGVDAIFHLAAGLMSRGNTEAQIFDFGLRGTYNLLCAARAGAPNIRRFLYASSDAVYWNAARLNAAYLPVDEAHPRQPGSVYGAVKVGCEELCLTFWRAFGIPATILRFGATANAHEVVGRRSRFAMWLFMRRMVEYLAGLPAPGADEQESLRILRGLDDGREQLVVMAEMDGTPEVRQWGDARDVAEGCALALESSVAVGEAFNLGGAAPFNADELARYMAPRLGLPVVTARLPIVRRPWYISSAKARGLLGYQPHYTIFDMVDDGLKQGAK